MAGLHVDQGALRPGERVVRWQMRAAQPGALRVRAVLVKTSSRVSEDLVAPVPIDPSGRRAPLAHLSTTFRLCTTVSISSCVVVRPKLNLIAPMPLCGGTRIACRTGDSSTAPEWHAEPVDAATSFSACRISAPILPGKQTFSVFRALAQSGRCPQWVVRSRLRCWRASRKSGSCPA